jgi:hypothetical protein
LSASEAPNPGRHHLGAPGDIISECPGDFVGIRRASFVGAVLVSAVASADDAALRFKGGIGVIPVSSFVNCPATNPCAIPAPGPNLVAVNRNIVRGVPPPGQIWVIDDLDALIGSKGNIVVRGKGLILASGDNTGRAPTPALFVFASLFCGAPTAPTESRTASAGVVLPPNGDFEIHDVLSPVPAATCENPMLLIRTTAAGNAWFAAGIVANDH